jgi:hypothetical protein
MRRLVIASLLASLALVSPASAKEIAGATICGADGCRSAGDGAVLHRLMPEGQPAVAPAAAPFLRVAMRYAHDDEAVTVRSVLVPSAGLLGSEGGWVRLGPRARAAFRRLADGLEALPPTRLQAALDEVGAAASEPQTQRPPEVFMVQPAAEASSEASSNTGVVVGVVAGVAVLLGLIAAATRMRRGHAGSGPATS